MNYPENLKIGDTIGICAPSAGIGEDEYKIKRYEAAIEQLKEMGYKVIETANVRSDYKARSSSAENRAKEFMELYSNDDVKLIIFASGGEYLCEMMDYLDLDKIKTMKPKWMQGYSDITGISFLFNTIFDIPSMYCQTIKDYAMRPLHRSLTDALKIESGEEIIQDSFDMYEADWNIENEDEDTEKDPYATYNLANKVEWKNLFGEKKIEIQGRTLGGCLDSIQCYLGTKYDKINEYIERHCSDGIVWFLECFEMPTPELLRKLWQMKRSGFFDKCNGIVFGRPLFIREDNGTTYYDSLKEALGDLNIPIIVDADIGHRSPQMAIVQGGMLKFISENGKGKVYTYLK